MASITQPLGLRESSDDEMSGDIFFVILFSDNLHVRR